MMNLYNEQITKVLEQLNVKNGKRLDTTGSRWQDAGRQNLVLRTEMAYELGAATLPAVGFLGVTSSEELVPTDGALLYGLDLPQISVDMPYARITLLRVDDGLMGKGEAISDAMCRFGNTRYGVKPKGYMSRISTGIRHEPVRVGKAALDEGLSFAGVARLYLDAYKAHREVIAAQVIFVTLPDFDYEKLAGLSQRNDEITAALDHILRDVKMDCESCKLQVICSEVEGMKALHFG